MNSPCIYRVAFFFRLRILLVICFTGEYILHYFFPTEKSYLIELDTQHIYNIKKPILWLQHSYSEIYGGNIKMWVNGFHNTSLISTVFKLYLSLLVIYLLLLNLIAGKLMFTKKNSQMTQLKFKYFFGSKYIYMKHKLESTVCIKFIRWFALFFVFVPSKLQCVAYYITQLNIEFLAIIVSNIFSLNIGNILFKYLFIPFISRFANYKQNLRDMNSPLVHHRVRVEGEGCTVCSHLLMIS